MTSWQGKIDCPERMLEAIRHYGIVPFFRCGIPGWSIEEMTPAECWFMSSQQLGPWDWKIDVIQSGEVAYGKYLRRKAGFATAEYYGHLLNWRRSQERYRILADVDGPMVPGCSGGQKGRKAPGTVDDRIKNRGPKTVDDRLKNAGLKTVDDRLNALMAKVALDAIKEFSSLESAELRQLLEERIPAKDRKSVGGHMEKYLLPKIKKTALDFTVQYLEMGCYVLTGDFQRVYRGPNCEYSGWQRASLTTPEALFGTGAPSFQNGMSLSALDNKTQNSSQPFWVKFIEGDSPASAEAKTAGQASIEAANSSTAATKASAASALIPDCTPQESYRILSERITAFFPGCEKELAKLLL